ncbi:MAG: hypothetical protein IPL78_34395 [Chloroflexi bacterium]|nr:hypothetical protein [Chloroflexota bacterium]
MIPDSQAFVIHDGLTSVVQLSTDWPQIITLTIVGPDDTEQGQIVLQAQADGYQVHLHTARSQQCLSFLTWPNQGKRVRDILPHYKKRLSHQAYQALDDEDAGNLLVGEFRRLLRKAIAYDTDPRPERHKQGRKRQTLYGAAVGLRPASCPGVSQGVPVWQTQISPRGLR